MQLTKMSAQSSLRPCKVIIAGAGVAGLTLALALEKNGIDFILLEAYPEIVAQVGGGICLMPNGLRILDQLGCYEHLRDQVKQVFETVYIRDPSGQELHLSGGWDKQMVDRWSYSGIWCDRKILLQTLYDHIADKSKLLARKRVATVRSEEDIVEVITTDGSTYAGDILIGTDGTHSRVRQEMVRLANERGVGHDYSDNEVSSTYACIFGTSSGVAGLEDGLLGWTLGKDYSYVVGTGPEDRTYWFLASKMEKTYHGAEIPTFSENDKKQMIQRHWNDQITPGLKMSDLYTARLHLVCNPIREMVYQKWSLDRLIVLGDAAHAMLPSIAQGGNQALESVAAMTNALLASLSEPVIGRMSPTEIRSMFEEVQGLRAQRALKIVALGRQRQQMDAMETPELEQFMLHKFSAMMPGILIDRWDAQFAPAISLRYPAVPPRPRECQFDDEKEQIQNAVFSDSERLKRIGGQHL
ncbi:hypothetical protein BDV59DRAFT_171955 [Aspergillus ambiguus]|uniref:FAD-dependent oxidoreductase n=1 Tax=Aspergillus ambiguus TaxID=176160 RepID=UPI003CCD1700